MVKRGRRRESRQVDTAEFGRAAHDLTWHETSHFLDASVETAKIADAAITSAKFAGTIESDNFTSGSAGWQIRRDTGSAEFNDVTVRGTIVAQSGELQTLSVTGTITVGSGGQVVFDHDTAMNLGGRWYVRKNAATLDFEVHDFITGVTRLRIQDGGPGELIDSGGSLVASWGVGLQVSEDLSVHSNGTAANPSMFFIGDPNTGVYSRTADEFNITVGGGERFRIAVGKTNSFQEFSPANDNSYGLGNSAQRWTEVWAVDGTINTSDTDEKTDLQDMPDQLGLDFLRAVRPVVGRWKGGTRLHSWLLADDVRDRLAERDVDLGMFVAPPDGPMGLRYHEFVAPLVKAVQELDGRLAALEA